MESSKARRTVPVTNSEGFHLRAATLFCNLARRFQSRIEIVKGPQCVDGKSTPLQLLALGAYQGDELVLEASGDDAEEALEALAELFASQFEDEDPNQQQVEQGPVHENPVHENPAEDSPYTG